MPCNLPVVILLALLRQVPRLTLSRPNVDIQLGVAAEEQATIFACKTIPNFDKVKSQRNLVNLLSMLQCLATYPLRIIAPYTCVRFVFLRNPELAQPFVKRKKKPVHTFLIMTRLQPSNQSSSFSAKLPSIIAFVFFRCSFSSWGVESRMFLSL